MPTRCSGFSLLEAPGARGSSCQAVVGCHKQAPGLCFPGMERVKCGGAGAAAERGGPALTRPSEGELSQQPPNPEAARGIATRCTRARAVGGRPARAPYKRRAHAEVSGRGQPSGWRGSKGARRAPGGGKARSIAALARTGAWRLRPRTPPTHPPPRSYRCARMFAYACAPENPLARLRVLGSGGRRGGGRERRAASDEVGDRARPAGLWRMETLGMEGRGGCSWQEVGTGAGLEGEGGFFLGKHRAGRGRAAGDSESPARAPPRPGSGRSLLRRRVFYWGGGGRDAALARNVYMVCCSWTGGSYAVCPLRHA